jgi:hypothetical protein
VDAHPRRLTGESLPYIVENGFYVILRSDIYSDCYTGIWSHQPGRFSAQYQLVSHLVHVYLFIYVSWRPSPYLGRSRLLRLQGLNTTSKPTPHKTLRQPQILSIGPLISGSQHRDYGPNSKNMSKAAKERTESQNRMPYMQVKSHRNLHHPIS